jgi:multidrug transporter EmrE-like cation transporter
MKTPPVSILFFVLAAVLGAVGQFLYKSGAERAAGGFVGYVANWRILAGALMYVGVMVLFVAAFKRGGALSVLYPIYASTFIWAAVIGCLAYGQPIRTVHIVGMFLLVCGMYLMGK